MDEDEERNSSARNLVSSARSVSESLAESVSQLEPPNPGEDRFEERYSHMSFTRRYQLEIIFAFYVFPATLTITLFNAVFMRKACLYSLSYNETVCDNLGKMEEAQKRVQVISNRYTTASTIVTTIPRALASLVAGHLTSRHGMKAPLAVATLGALVTNALRAYTFYDMALPLVYSVLAELPDAFSGVSGGVTGPWQCTNSALFRGLAASLSCVTRLRPNKARFQLIAMLVCLIFTTLFYSGAMNLTNYYFNLLFKWEPEEFSFAQALSMTCTMVISMPVLGFFSTVLRLSDPAVIAIGFAFAGLKFVMLSVAFLGVGVYVAQTAAGIPFIGALVAIRSHLSRLLPHSEVAAVFALASTTTRVVPIVFDALATLVYERSLNYFPGLVFAAQAALFFVPVALSCACVRWTKRYGLPTYSEVLVDDN